MKTDVNLLSLSLITQGVVAQSPEPEAHVLSVLFLVLCPWVGIFNYI